jgi:hypothetical protein
MANPYHEPKGSSKGGQFAESPSGKGQYDSPFESEEEYKRYKTEQFEILREQEDRIILSARKAAGVNPDDIIVKLDSSYLRYHKNLPEDNAVRKGGWAFTIGAKVKYFQGTYREAVIEAQKLALEENVKEIYLKP